jgi:2-dehydro-3-deoxygluconokinase
MKKILLMGEPMAMFVADSVGELENVSHYTRMLAGAEVNVCIALKRLGFSPIYITKLGDDPMGHNIKNRLNEEGIGTENVTFDTRYLTGLQFKSKVTEGDPAVAYFRKGSAASHMSVRDIENIDMSEIDLVHLTGIPPALSKECREASFALLKKAKEHNIFVTFDPNLRPTLWENEPTMIDTINELAGYADIVLPGLSEGQLLTGKETIDDVANFYIEKGVKTVIIKEGATGAHIFEKNSHELVGGFKVDKIVDTVGAGDGFASGVISGLLDGLDIHEAVLRGNAIGAIQVSHKGDNEGLPNRQELATFIENN